MPSSFAGVTGPCPSCSVLIQAPFPVQQPPAQPVLYTAPPAPITPPPAAYLHREPTQPTAERVVLRPAPRQLPDRTEPIEAPTRIRRDPSGDTRPRNEPAIAPRDRGKRNAFLRFTLPVVFLCMTAGVIYGVNKVLSADRSSPATSEKSVTDLAKATGVKPIIKSGTSFEALTNDGTETLSVGSTGPTDSQVNTPAPPVDTGAKALELLEKFLAMKSLEERMPYLETKRSNEVLTASVLNRPLPEVLKISVSIREINSLEQVVDHFYNVDFADGNGGINPQTMLVRVRGEESPRVVVDPFLDLFGGKFAEFAAKPQKGSGTFLVIIAAGGRCYEDVPDPEKKLTMKIFTREDTKEIAKAYFGEQSSIGGMLRDEASGLGFGMAKACTVFMRWNLDDDPERPFLEALEIKALNWNP